VGTITDIEGVRFWDPRKKETQELGVTREKMNLKEEAEEQARIILEGDREAMKKWEEHSLIVEGITESVRRENELLFPVEREEKQKC
jgi:hypothetical protein